MAKKTSNKRKKFDAKGNNKKLKCLLVFVKKGHGVATNELLLENGCSMTTMMYAEGTRDKYVLNILGDKQNAQEAILAICREDRYPAIKEALETRFIISAASKGSLLAFDITSMAGVLAYKFLSDYEGVNNYGK